MKIQFSLYGFMVFIGLMLTAAPADAYFTTKQSARAFNDTTALYTITYRFGFLNREVYIPVSTERATSSTARDRIGYTIVDSHKTTLTTGSTSALVLSTAAIKDGMYYLPQGQSADFTLAALLTIPKGMSPQKYALQASALPFDMIVDGKTVKGQLNPSELQYYVTPNVALPPVHITAKVVGVTYTLRTAKK
jgi:hypothetical protein